MAERTVRKFYLSVATDKREGGRHGVTLDGRPLRTPARHVLELPTAGLAEAIAKEWIVQDEVVHLDAMPLTLLANAALDRVAVHREAIIEQVIAFGRTDLLCYRAGAPEELVRRQAAAWDPPLNWAREKYGITLQTGEGIGFIEQPKASLAALNRIVSALDDFVLTGLHGAATISGSLILALALVQGAIDADKAFVASQIEPTYQSEKWGGDEESEAKAARIAREFQDIARFLSLLRPAALPPIG